jgi:hypothetical protein
VPLYTRPRLDQRHAIRVGITGEMVTIAHR